MPDIKRYIFTQFPQPTSLGCVVCFGRTITTRQGNVNCKEKVIFYSIYVTELSLKIYLHCTLNSNKVLQHSNLINDGFPQVKRAARGHVSGLKAKDILRLVETV